MPLAATPLLPSFAARIAGVDLAALTPGETAALREAIDTYSVLILPSQTLDDDNLLALGKTFGDVEPPRNHRVVQRLKHAELADISNLDGSNRLRPRDDQRRLDSLGNRLWHSDASFRAVPGALSMLFAHVVPPVGGETEFADLRAAYDALPRDMQARIDGLMVEHSIFYSHIVGWPMPDGRLLLRDLMEHATQREFVHRHEWRVGDLVIWDNRCTLHRGRAYDDAQHPRDLRRVTTKDLSMLQPA